MKRTITILVAVLAAVTLTGVLLELTRTASMPESVRRFDWRRQLKSAIADHVEALAEELPA